MKRVFKSLGMAMSAIILLALPVFAYDYYAPLTVTETSGNDYTMLGLTVSVDNQYLADNDYIDADALDTAVETLGGTERAHMVVDDRLLTAAPVPGDSQVNLYYTMGNTPATNFEIVAGDGGYVTTTDAAALECSDDFEIEFSGWIPTDKQQSLVSKGDEFLITTAQEGGLLAIIDHVPGTTNVPDNGTSDPDAFWTDDGTIDDSDTGTGADAANTAEDSWTSYLISQDTGTIAYAIQTYAEMDADWIEIDVDAYYGAAYHDVYQGAYSNTAWDTWYISDGLQTVTNVRVRFYNTGAAQVEVDLFREIRLISENGAQNTQVLSTTMTAGEYIINASADTVNFDLDVDGVNEDTTALGGANMDDIGDDWLLYADPYWTYYEHTVSGTLIAHYEPDDMIIGTALPDLEGAAQDGAFTFGSNPAGVSVSLGSLLSASQPNPGTDLDEEPQDVLPAAEVTDWFEEPDVTGTLLTNPLRPFVTIMSDTTTLSEMQAWQLLAFAFILLVTIGTAKVVRGHHMITGIVCGATIGGIVALTIWPFWALLFAIGAVLLGAISERSPSL